MATELSVEKLLEEIRTMQRDFSRVSEALLDRARRETTETAARVRHAAEDGWAGAKGAASDVAGKIEEQPLAATAIAFGVGMLVGMLFLGRRR
jgi:ElaB/YqjD/DUF883 family membrane-anchored ribosome-binding protein